MNSEHDTSMLGRTKLDLPALVRRVGPALTLRIGAEQVWHTKLFLGLRCDLARLPDVPPAKEAIVMQRRGTFEYGGFEQELTRAMGRDYIEVLFRIRSCSASVEALYAADGSDRGPAYAQWLVRPADQELLHRHAPGRYAVLGTNEVLLEGAYTFSAYRRMGIMVDGMAQLLRIASSEGFQTATTYVSVDNLSSLRGCSRVGFTLDHVRHNVRRLGRRESLVRPTNSHAQTIWGAATGSDPDRA